MTPRLLPYGLLIPGLAAVAIVSILPIFYAVRLSLFDTNFLQIGEFNGLGHYATIFFSETGRLDLGRTLVYVLSSLLLTMPLAVTLSLLLNRELRFRSVLRVLILLPWIVSQTIAALLWRWLLNPQFGPLPLDDIFGAGFDPLTDPNSAMVALILVNVWMSYPLATMLTLAALQTVPGELIEAAKVDGAGALQTVFRIVLPLIRPSLLVVAISLTLLYFNMVTLILTFTGGGPFGGTQTLSLTAFRESFQFYRIGLGAAYSVVLFIFNIIFAAAYVRVLRRDPYAS